MRVPRARGFALVWGPAAMVAVPILAGIARSRDYRPTFVPPPVYITNYEKPRIGKHVDPEIARHLRSNEETTLMVCSDCRGCNFSKITEFRKAVPRGVVAVYPQAGSSVQMKGVPLGADFVIDDSGAASLSLPMLPCLYRIDKNDRITFVQGPEEDVYDVIKRMGAARG